MMSEPERHAIVTLEDMVRLYAELPDDRAELMLKEMGDAIRMMAPLADFLVSPIQPVTWINDTKGKADVRVSSVCETLDIRVKVDLPEGGAA